MANQYIQPDDIWPSAQYGFSQVVVSTGTKIIHCAGQTAWDKDMNLVGGDDLEAQTAQALENIKSTLTAAGATMNDVVRVDIYVVDYNPDKIPPIDAAMSRYFDPDRLPASTLLGIAALAMPEFLIEITATAVVDA